jgi:hypothetical protein
MKYFYFLSLNFTNYKISMENKITVKSEKDLEIYLVNEIDKFFRENNFYICYLPDNQCPQDYIYDENGKMKLKTKWINKEYYDIEGYYTFVLEREDKTDELFLENFIVMLELIKNISNMENKKSALENVKKIIKFLEELKNKYIDKKNNEKIFHEIEAVIKSYNNYYKETEKLNEEKFKAIKEEENKKNKWGSQWDFLNKPMGFFK